MISLLNQQIAFPLSNNKNNKNTLGFEYEQTKHNTNQQNDDVVYCRLCAVIFNSWLYSFVSSLSLSLSHAFSLFVVLYFIVDALPCSASLEIPFFTHSYSAQTCMKVVNKQVLLFFCFCLPVTVLLSAKLYAFFTNSLIFFVVYF